MKSGPGRPIVREALDRRVEAAYGFALLLTMTSILVTIAAGGGKSAPIAAGLMQGLTLVAVLLVSGARGWWIGALLMASTVVTLLASLTAWLVGATFPVVPVVSAVIVGAAIVAVMRRLRDFHAVTVQMVLGLLTVYLLIGLLFAHVDLLVSGLVGGFFVGGQEQAAAFVYFSYVTLATVGYGDLTPVAGLPQALAVLEALVGQLYLVSVVALAVGRFGLERGARRER